MRKASFPWTSKTTARGASYSKIQNPQSKIQNKNPFYSDFINNFRISVDKRFNSHFLKVESDHHAAALRITSPGSRRAARRAGSHVATKTTAAAMPAAQR